MTRDDFRTVLLPLVLAMRAEFDGPTWVAYHLALEDVTESLLAATVLVLVRESREFFPKSGEIRAACERQRRVLLAVHRHDGCCDCEHAKGWIAVTTDGVTRMDRCGCIERHRAKLKSMGLLEPLSSLPGESGAGDETVYPTMGQLPAPIREQLATLASRKQLR